MYRHDAKLESVSRILRVLFQHSAEVTPDNCSCKQMVSILNKQKELEQDREHEANLREDRRRQGS